MFAGRSYSIRVEKANSSFRLGLDAGVRGSPKAMLFTRCRAKHYLPSNFSSSSTVVTGAWQVKFWQT